MKLLSKQQRDEIRTKYKTGKYTEEQLATEYNVSDTTISDTLKERHFRRKGVAL